MECNIWKRCPCYAREVRTSGAAFVELRGRLVEQRVDGEGEVELLLVELLPRRRQSAGRVRVPSARLPPPARLVICTVTVAVLLLAIACAMRMSQG
jgi:hypothetical protein